MLMREHPIRQFARSKSLTLAQVAELAGISRMTLHRVLRGENTTLDLLRRLSAVTGGSVSVQQLAATPAPDRAGVTAEVAA